MPLATMEKEEVEIAILVLGWFALGASGFIFWWTKDYDVTVADVPKIAVISVVGIFTWAIGFFVHGPMSNNDRVLIRKRHNA